MCLRLAVDDEQSLTVEDVDVDEPVVQRVVSPPAAAHLSSRANGIQVTSATTAQKQNKRRGKCVGDVPVVPITRYFTASPAAAAAAAAAAVV